MKKSNRRWRFPWSHHCRLVKEHGLRFVSCAGGVNHYSKMPIELMESTNELIRSLARYSEQYENWIRTSGAVKRPEKFL